MKKLLCAAVIAAASAAPSFAAPAANTGPDGVPTIANASPDGARGVGAPAPTRHGGPAGLNSALTPEEEARAFLSAYSASYQGVYAVSQDVSWAASTDVTPEHDGGRIAANKALAAVTGSRYVIETARRLLARKAELSPLTARQLEKVWLDAAENPATIPDVVAKRVEAESRQSSVMDSFQFCLEKKPEGACAKPVTANEMDDILVSSRDLSLRLKTWNASKEIGPALKPGLARLQGLRNAAAREFGYSSYYDLQAADLGMNTKELAELLDGFINDIQPLYEQLHCWTKYELAKRYNQPVPKLIPAHWIGNRWAQEWPGIVDGVDLNPLFKDRKPEWIIRQAEDFWVSMGFAKLPEAFWKKSDLYPVPSDGKRNKNTHASAWHIDLDQDVRSLMSVEPDAQWWGTAHHELGHIFYFQAYARPQVPVLLRRGGNRAWHEGIAELGALAAMQAPYLEKRGVLPEGRKIDQNRWLLNEALEQTIAFMPWAAGTVSAWERDLYDGDLPPEKWNARWWELAAKYQGIAPPPAAGGERPAPSGTASPGSPRGEEYCDGCTKTHVNDNPAYYYNYALATVMKYQLHTHICRNILKVDPHACTYYGSRAVGDFLRGLMSAGATRDWRELWKEKLGEDLSTKPMMDYFGPLLDYLKKENKGRSCGWR